VFYTSSSRLTTLVQLQNHQCVDSGLIGLLIGTKSSSLGLGLKTSVSLTLKKNELLLVISNGYAAVIILPLKNQF
jgi:hypothetical protein